MSKSRYSRIVVAIIALFVVAGLPASAQSPPGSDPEPEQILTPEETLRLIAEHYAADFEVTIEEAERRLKLQPIIGELNASLVKNEPDIFTAVDAQHQPDFRVIVRVTEGGKQRVRPYFADGPLKDLVQVEIVRWSLAKLRFDQSKAHAVARQLGINMASQIGNQQVIVFVTDTARLQARLRKANLQLPATVIVREAPVLSIPDSDLLGGIGLSTCTSGFAGERTSSSEKGVFTAGHCSASQSFEGNLLSPVYDFSDANTDIQFHVNSSGERLRNLVWIGNNTWVPITGVYWYDWQYIDGYVCKMGVNSGYTCGTIESKNYNPGCPYEEICRNSTFVRVDDGEDDLSVGGDSGGPWIGSSGTQHNSAFGIHSGSPGDDSTDAFYTAIDSIYTHNYKVLIDCGSNYYCD